MIGESTAFEPAAELMTGFPAPRWVAGGEALKALARWTCDHEDIEMFVFSDSVPALRAQLGGTFHR